jgi:putative multiple sugar transport system substrate-binding protein
MKGDQYSTIFKDTNKLVAQAIVMVNALQSGGTPEVNDTKSYNNGVKVVPSYLLPVVTVYKDDIQKELVDTGYYTADEVAKGQAS